MKVLIGGSPVTLGDSDLLGAGGEANVYRHGALAVKIYHPIDPQLPATERKKAQALLDARFAKVRAFPRGLPAEVIAPLDVVTDPSNRPVGFTMRALAGATEVLHLSRRAFREGVVSSGEVTSLFARLHALLRAVHAAGVIVGDLNDGNVVFCGPDVSLIDADSMQFGRFPCVMAHERFLDPRFYGRDLGAAPVFDSASDWYAFAVMLFGSLLYVHPYGGTHPKYPTALRRAEEAYSVLRADVKYPKNAVHHRVLPDEILSYFERVFDRGERGELPERLLSMAWTRCRCGTEHARAVCPECASKGMIVTRPAVRNHGACRAILIFRTGGRILTASVQRNLKYVYEENGVVRRENGERVMEQTPRPGMRFAISGPTTWVGWNRDLVAVEKEAPRARERTQTFDGEPSFDAGTAGCFRLEQEWLMEGSLRLGKILEGRTWFRTGEKLGFGFYRAGLATFWFVFRPGRPGLTDVRLPPIQGRIVEAAASFDDKHVLFSIAVEHGGRRHAALYLVDDGGRVLGRMEGAPQDQRALAAVRGKCVLGGRMLAATEDGLLALEVDRATGLIVERTLFSDTEPFVSLGADLLPGPGGSVYLVTNHEICELVLA